MSTLLSLLITTQELTEGLFSFIHRTRGPVIRREDRVEPRVDSAHGHSTNCVINPGPAHCASSVVGPGDAGNVYCILREETPHVPNGLRGNLGVWMDVGRHETVGRSRAEWYGVDLASTPTKGHDAIYRLARIMCHQRANIEIIHLEVKGESLNPLCGVHLSTTRKETGL